ncbi:hypothetical protein BGW36DRAFT_371669 [Talaromyces proteolyticus]|uniref:Putative zinc-finger domain-containing protein n=1 Tax=Talaromyces proteolyticus TaxID=1131652 RepID=A0AAD4L0G2_9EURO|nr:uncharacterized protein BGW36DRAFT_371669 [Talaromyces proteolyticus]KAH8701846.1 hypothetical protein BGW36DRAFT_371669 [Talaromyces proteolyticus]
MSQFPPTPTFPGPSKYGQHWSAHVSHNSSGRPEADFHSMNNPMATGNFATLPFVTHPATQLPGLGMPSDSIPSVYLPHSFSENLDPVPHPGATKGSIFFTPDASLSTPAFRQPHPSAAFQPQANQPTISSHEGFLPTTQDETDREEGEVSDASGNESANLRSNQYQRERSESPYNPPMTITIDPVTAASQRATRSSSEFGSQDEFSESSNNEPSYITGKTVAQIRVMAQGALLGLAPHNIRFHELLKENIDPNILKQLYDDIGIKITHSLSDSNSLVKHDTIDLTATPEASRKYPTTNVTISPPASAQINAPSSAVLTEKEEPSVSLAGKPLERKDVIARMLAAKAKKSAIAVPKSRSAEPTLRPASVMMSDTSEVTEVAVSPKASAATQPKEKNKAQTELARQRIEQLKKMGLKRQQFQQENFTTAQGTANIAPNSKTISPPILSHPLPERPPFSGKPQTPPQMTTSNIPGISTSSSDAKSSPTPTNIENISSNATRPGRTPAKRPRASDFDEFVPKSKKPLVTEDRLVIDISEDESSDNDGNDAAMLDAMDDTASQKSSFPHSSGLSYQRSSASATPQNRLNDAESLRQKDLAIKAMRRRIAEFEEKKAKKGNETTVSSVSASESLGSTDNLPGTTNNRLEAPQALLAKSTASNISMDSPIQLLASMDLSDLDKMRLKLLRKQEIETGLPTLDDEISRIQAKLAGFKTQEEGLLAEIVKGREGRKQLMDELETLIIETQGLTMEAVQAATEEKQRADAAQGNSFDNEANATSPNTQARISEDSKLIKPQSVNQTLPVDHEISSIGHGSPETCEDPCDIFEPQDSNLEASDSSMDESSSSPEPSSIEEELEPEPEPEPQISTSLPSNESPNIHNLDSDPLPTGGSEDVLDMPGNAESNEPVAENLERNTSQDSLMVSDNYEPPEPEDGEEVYSPQLGPSGDDVEMDTIPVSPSSHSEADVELTPKLQEQVVIASKNDALDNVDRAIKTFKFSPYESPLKYFRAYRYHPNFAQEVSDSYRSLKYSHKIDPSLAICPYESAGGVCNDTTCEFQHWRDMVMPDDKILVEMGNQREGKTAEERDEFLEGLKTIINTLQRDQVKDFFTVANEIAAYRRRFLSDPSRILPL